jgi:hypothetical protein
MAASELLLAYRHGRPAQTMSMRKITSVTELTDEELAVIANARQFGEVHEEAVFALLDKAMANGGREALRSAELILAQLPHFRLKQRAISVY